MLTKRVIACLDVRGGRVVKGVQFVDIVDAGDPAELAHRHAAAGADEIVLLDITATHEGRGTLLDTVKRTAEKLFVPFTVGGGMRSAEDASAVFDAGADKVSINSAAIARPELIGEIGGSFGAQAVIVAIDARRGPAGSERCGGVCEWRTEGYGAAGGGLGSGSGGTGGGGDPADEHEHGWDAEWVRLRVDGGGECGGADSGDCEWWGGDGGALCGGVWAWARRMRRWRRVSFTLG